MVLICLKEGNNKQQDKKLLKSIKLYLQEIQVIHSVRKKAFKAHSKIMYSKKLKGTFCLCVLYTKHATEFLFSLTHVWRDRILMGEDKRHVWVAATLLPPWTSSRNSKQTLKSTISLLVFPSDGAAEHSSQSPAHATTEEEEQKIQSAKGTLAPVLCINVCV